MIPWIFLIALLVIYCITLPPLLKRAGMNPTLGYIPLVNFYPFLRMIKRPWWWLFLILCPGVNLLVFVIMNVELGIAFNKRSTKDQWFFGALPWVALPQLAFKHTTQAYVGPRDWTGKKKSTVREWGEAIVFAVIAASVIRTFFIEAFTIPTPSMEKSMLVGDYLFVSKVSYGAKIPQTPVAVPFVHNAMPGSMTNSYVEWFSLPYYRLPGFGNVERFDPVVFNFPNGDTIMVDPYYAGHDYYANLNAEAIKLAGGFNKMIKDEYGYREKARQNFRKGTCVTCTESNKKIQGVKARPMDKRENYVKRCIGLPGDNISIKNGQVYINDQAIENPAGLMFSYTYKVKGFKEIQTIWEHCKVNMEDRRVLIEDIVNTNMGPQKVMGYVSEKKMEEGMELVRDSLNYIEAVSSFTQEDVAWLKTNTAVISLDVNVDSVANTSNPFEMFPNFPMAPFSEWTRDNYGPVHIPKKDETVELTPENLAMYRRVITNYENNSLETREGSVYINGQQTTTYTFKQDYYWMMGDNRHQSADSRFWGFVPEDHIVGKPVFTWFSKEDKGYQEGGEVRWKRMFRLVK